MVTINAILILSSLTVAAPAGETIYQRVARFVRSQELKALPKAPAWYPPGNVRFRFVQITDVHLAPRWKPYLLKACSFVNERVKPVFVVVTGDNAGTSSLAGQKRFHQILTESLQAPFFVIRGDNWPRNFVEVFGSFQWSFDCGGLRFIASGLDVDVEGLGVGHFLPATKTWLAGEISRAADRPVIYFQHENIQPPTFLDASHLDKLFEASSNVLLTMSGHLHADIESKTGRVLHLVAPAVGPHRTHGFKVVEVYTDQIVVRTVEYSGDAYDYVHKYQRVLIPAKLRGKMKGAVARVENHTRRPRRDTTFDQTLLRRQPELGIQFMLYAHKTGNTGALLKELTK